MQTKNKIVPIDKKIEEQIHNLHEGIKELLPFVHDDADGVITNESTYLNAEESNILIKLAEIIKNKPILDSVKLYLPAVSEMIGKTVQGLNKTIQTQADQKVNAALKENLNNLIKQNKEFVIPCLLADEKTFLQQGRYHAVVIKFSPPRTLTILDSIDASGGPEEAISKGILQSWFPPQYNINYEAPAIQNEANCVIYQVMNLITGGMGKIDIAHNIKDIRTAIYNYETTQDEKYLVEIYIIMQGIVQPVLQDAKQAIPTIPMNVSHAAITSSLQPKVPNKPQAKDEKKAHPVPQSEIKLPAAVKPHSIQRSAQLASLLQVLCGTESKIEVVENVDFTSVICESNEVMRAVIGKLKSISPCPGLVTVEIPDENTIMIEGGPVLGLIWEKLNILADNCRSYMAYSNVKPNAKVNAAQIAEQEALLKLSNGNQLSKNEINIINNGGYFNNICREPLFDTKEAPPKKLST